MARKNQNILLEEYKKTVEPIFQKMKNNNSQIKILSQLHNTLLPKLIKGEIRVKSFSSFSRKLYAY